MYKVRKFVLIVTGVIILCVALAILFISPLTKYLVEKYDQKYTGREITMNSAYVNPFTGYILFSHLKIYELKSDSVFFSTDGLSLNVDMLKLFSKTYSISEIALSNPYGIIIQNKRDFNFNDLIKKFTKEQPADTTLNPVHFSIASIRIINGEFHYMENSIPVNYFIKKVNIESTGLYWNVDSVITVFSFLPGIGKGDAKGSFIYNLKSNSYQTAFVINKLDLNIIGQYLKELTNYGSFTANLDASITANGNFNNGENISATGLLALNDFHFGKSKGDDLAAFERLSLAIDEISPVRHKYLFDSVSLIHPYFRYERYDSLDNIQTMFGKNGENIKAVSGNDEKFNLIIEIADYIKILSKKFFKSNYRVNKLAVYHGDLIFLDFSQGEKFSIALNPLSIFSDSIDKKHKRVSVAVNSEVQPYGNMNINLSINPKDSSDFDLDYTFKKLSLAAFNPYLISFTSFPVDRGTLELKGTWNVRNGNIKSDNHLLIIDPRLNKRLKYKDNKWIPMRLLFAFVRERGNVIDYEIPVTGNLNDPKFNVRDVMRDALVNIFVKPATTAYRTEVKQIETEIEKSLSLKWEMKQDALQPKQVKFIEQLADFLKHNPEANIMVKTQPFTEKEKEGILFFEAKRKYLISTGQVNQASLSKKDIEIVNKFSVRNNHFLKYLDKKSTDSFAFTIQQKCASVVSTDMINLKFKILCEARENEFVSIFKQLQVEHQVRIAKGPDLIPYNGFSVFKMDYKGELPASLLKAYGRMNELNDAAPRKKFKNERKGNVKVNL